MSAGTRSWPWIALLLAACSAREHDAQPLQPRTHAPEAAPGSEVATTPASPASAPPARDAAVREPARAASASQQDSADGGEAPARATDACADLRSVAGEVREVQVGQQMRAYLLHVPQSASAPLPLVLDLHDLQSHAAFQRRQSGFAAAADGGGFAVAYPLAQDGAWNLGADACCNADPDVDDIGFMRALVASLTRGGCLDARRVYAAGSGVGGALAQQLACRAADVFAAVLSRDFDLLQDAAGACAPSRPIAVMLTRDPSDARWPYEGGEVRPDNGLPVRVRGLGASAALARWARLSHCSDALSPVVDGCRSHQSCGGGVALQLCDAAHASALEGWAFLRRFQLP